MTDASQGMVAFLGVAADRRLLDEDRFNLPDAEQYRTRAVATQGHGRLVAAGSALTGITLVGGVALASTASGRRSSMAAARSTPSSP